MRNKILSAVAVVRGRGWRSTKTHTFSVSDFFLNTQGTEVILSRTLEHS